MYENKNILFVCTASSYVVYNHLYTYGLSLHLIPQNVTVAFVFKICGSQSCAYKDYCLWKCGKAHFGGLFSNVPKKSAASTLYLEDRVEKFARNTGKSIPDHRRHIPQHSNLLWYSKFWDSALKQAVMTSFFLPSYKL